MYSFVKYFLSSALSLMACFSSFALTGEETSSFVINGEKYFLYNVGEISLANTSIDTPISIVSTDNYIYVADNQNNSGSNFSIMRYNPFDNSPQGSLDFIFTDSRFVGANFHIMNDSEGALVALFCYPSTTSKMKCVVLVLDTKDGSILLNKEFSMTGTNNYNIVGYPSIVGDVVTGNFELGLPVFSTNNKYIRLAYSKFNGWEQELSDYYSISANNDATPRRPVCKALGNYRVVIDDEINKPTLVDFYNYPASAQSLSGVQYAEARGYDTFEYDGITFALMSDLDNTSQFMRLAQVTDKTTMASTNLLTCSSWPLGRYDEPRPMLCVSQHYNTKSDLVQFYVLTPACGIKCYQLSHNDSVTGVGKIKELMPYNYYTLRDNTLMFGSEQTNVEVYDLTGRCVAKASNVREIVLPYSSGCYIVSTAHGAFRICL